MNTGLKKLVSAGVGVFLGVLIWALSPIISGNIEPWDSEGPYYVGSLFLSGVIVCMASRRNFLIAVTGIYVGQVLFLLIIALGPLSFVGIILLIPYSLIALFGGLLFQSLMFRK